MLAYSATRDGVLPSICCGTPKRGTVYSTANVGVRPNDSWSTPRQAYKSPAIGTRNNPPQNRQITSRAGSCTPQEMLVYSPTRDGVLPSKYWCTPQQGTVYSPANVGVLPNDFWCTP